MPECYLSTFDNGKLVMPGTKMSVEDIHPDLQQAFRRMPNVSLRSPLPRIFMKAIMSVSYRAQADDEVARHTHRFSNFSVRVYQPKGPTAGAGILFIHGGGYVLGNAKMNDATCNAYVKDLGVTVVSVDYRLAPKHPYPAPLDDCYEAWRWLVDNAPSYRVDPSRIIVAGQSAGGGLAAALCQRILDEGGLQPVAQLLYYPMIDDRTALDKSLTNVRHLAWNNESNFYGWSSYLGSEPGQSIGERAWAVPSRREDLTGLPPAWIGVGDQDLFYQEDLAYAAQLKRCGVDTDLEVVEGCPHGFDAVAPDAEISQRFRNSSLRFLRSHIAEKKADPARE